MTRPVRIAMHFVAPRHLAKPSAERKRPARDDAAGPVLV
jgi:hypothetical protein